MSNKKDILVQLAQNVDLEILQKFAYSKNGKLISAIDEFIDVLSQCQEKKNEP